MSPRAVRRTGGIVAAVVVAVVVSGCGGGIGSSSGPVEPSVSTPASSAAVPPDSAHAGATALTPQARAAIASAMRAYGMSLAATSSMTMSYSADRQQVTVTGAGIRTRPARAKPMAPPTVRTVQSVTLENANGTWRVLNVVSEK